MPEQNITLSTIAREISDALKADIINRIDSNDGVIRFSEFMQRALYTPQLGYYQNQLYTFGEAGDFITAPEMGNLFGQCIADSIGSMAKQHNQILEIGAGSGALARTITQALASCDWPNDKSLEYKILEPSAQLQMQQKEALLTHEKPLVVDYSWLSDFPQKFNGVILANEVLDAIPVERIQKTAQGWQYLGVATREGQFIWQPAGLVMENDLPVILRESDVFIEGYTTEIRPLVNGWINGLSKSLNNGVILLFDYGYPRHDLYHPQRTDGTLRCFSRHQTQQDALQLVGLQDITAHVDFTQVAEAAVEAGLSVDGFTTQSGFLVENGIANLSPDSPGKENYQYSRQVQQLTSPGQMGELVKVIQLSKSSEQLANGFALQDHMHRL